MWVEVTSSLGVDTSSRSNGETSKLNTKTVSATCFPLSLRLSSQSSFAYGRSDIAATVSDGSALAIPKRSR
jgi:hypothetical protein